MKNVGILKYAIAVLLIVPHVSYGMKYKQTAYQSQTAQECQICFDVADRVALHGNHTVCTACLGDQIDAAHRNRNGADLNQLLKCPSSGCQHDITLDEVRRIIPAYLPQFQEIMQARAQTANPQEEITFKDHQNLQWKFENTKPCPRCHRAIEKNGGCNFVVCTQCQTDFCYRCLHISWGTGEVTRGHEWNHRPCVPNNDPWKDEKNKLRSQNVSKLAIGAVIALAAIWGISEIYTYFTKKKKKNAPNKRPLNVVKRVPRNTARVR